MLRSADSAQGERFCSDTHIEAEETGALADAETALKEIFGHPDDLLEELGICSPGIQSRPLDVNIWADYPELNRLLDELADEIGVKGKRKRTEKEADRFREALRIIVLGLYVAWRADPDLCVGINLGSDWYRPQNRYGNPALKYRHVQAAYAGLKGLGYLTVERRGYWNHKKRSGETTRIRATETLIMRLVEEADIRSHRIRRLPGAETIILKEEKDPDDYARNLQYVDTDATNEMRENLKIINMILEAHSITLAVTSQELRELQERLRCDSEKGPLDFNRRTLRRIFNNGNFDQGGRFYGGWWQQIPNPSDPDEGTAYRQFITIDDEPTIELDYSGCHPRMLYAEIGFEFPGDPYDVGQPAECRDIVKETFNKMINAEHGRIAEPKGFDEAVMGMTFDELIERIKAKHQPIAGHFFTGAGLRLQYRDSCIAEKVMMRFAKKNVACLCIHDSFIVQRRYAGELERVMREVALEEIGVELPIKGLEQCVSLGVGE